MCLPYVYQAGSIQRGKVAQEKIHEIYNKLYPFTQVSEEQKLQHIHNIKIKHSTPQFKNKR